MADSGISFKLLLDAAGFTEGVKNAREAMKKMIDEVGKKSFFEKLNTDVKRVTGTFAQMAGQLGNGDIFGSLASSSSLAAMSIGELGASAIPLAAVAVAATAVGVGSKKMWDSMSRANELKALAEGSMMSVKELMGLEQAFSRIGVDLEEVPQLMGHFIDTIKELGDPSSKAAMDFARIGLSLSNFQGKTAIESLYIFSEAITKAKDKSEAFLAVQDAFGLKRASRVLPALTPQNLERSAKQTLGNADIYEQQAQQFLDFQQSIKRLAPSLDSFFAGLNSKIIPVFIDLVSKIEKVDLSKLGGAIADIFVPFAEFSAKHMPAIISAMERTGAIIAMFVNATIYLANLVSKLLTGIMNIPGVLFGSDAEKGIPEKPNRFPEDTTPKRISPFSFLDTWFESVSKKFLSSTPSEIVSKTSTEQKTEGKPEEGPVIPPKSNSPPLNFPQLPLPIITPIVDSLTKIGGAGNLGGEDAIDVQREQLNVLRDISASMKAFSRTFKPDSNTYLPTMYGSQFLAS